MGALPRAAVTAFAVAIVVPIAACGYRFVHYGMGGDAGPVSSVAVRTLDNGSFEPGYELTVTDALRREFLERGAVTLAGDPEQADLVLSGRVQPIDTKRRSFSSVVLTVQYELQVRIDLLGTRRDGTEVSFDPRLLSQRELYLASADLEATRKNRDEALRRIASALAARVHDVVYEAAIP